jgi:hypothetical protein
MQFTLTITLGNDLMSEPGHVAGALTRAAERIAERPDLGDFDHGVIVDGNGNGVGGWTVTG